ncbi:MAG: HupE/UreJ family protein [Verrucomicrobiales bacterium]
MRIWLGICFFLWATAFPGRAHSGFSIFTNSAHFEFDDDELQLTVQVSAAEICAVNDFQVDDYGAVDKQWVEQAAPKHAAYFFKHFTVHADGVLLSGKVVNIRLPPTWETVHEGVDRCLFTYKIHYPLAKPAAVLRVWQNMLNGIPHDDGVPFTFVYTVLFNRLGEDSKDLSVLPANVASEYATDLGQPNSKTPANKPHAGLTRFLNSGMDHVLTGYDHLLFASALVLALRGFWDILKIIGIFTLAHSITITLAAYRLLPEMGWVEKAISASIVVVALENIFFPKSARSRWRLLSVFALGLVHGMGLAGHFVKSLEGLDGMTIGLVILLFCVGVELGHLCIVGPLNLMLAAGRKWLGGEKFGSRAMRYGSMLVALVGCYYFASQMEWVPEDYRPDKVLGSG